MCFVGLITLDVRSSALEALSMPVLYPRGNVGWSVKCTGPTGKVC